MLLVGAVATPNVDQTVHAPRRSGAHVSDFLVGSQYNWGEYSVQELQFVSTIAYNSRCTLVHVEHYVGLPLVEQAYDDIIPEVPVKVGM
jgi:hypothetical protein